MPPSAEDFLQEVLLTETQIQDRIKELGTQISNDYRGKQLMLLCVLKGGVLFLTDLMRHLTIPHEIDFLAVSSYGRGIRESTGVVRIVKDLEEPIDGKHILIVEDIIDSGVTLSYLLQLLAPRNPASLKICTLLNKWQRRKTKIPVDYIGFDIEDKFVFGYGLDLDELFRNLPYVGVAKTG
ncbi:MAG: hypoxanthine phosphoribosyltransferase [Anaerolineae bacterium]